MSVNCVSELGGVSKVCVTVNWAGVSKVGDVGKVVGVRKVGECQLNMCDSSGSR